jgi:hypothetical protein
MKPLRTISSYTKELVSLSKSALVEVTTALLPYYDRMVLGGGWAPFFIIEKFGDSGNDHCGSIDIDFIIHPEIAKDPYISDIAHLLEINNFQKLPEDPFPFRFAPPLKTGKDINIDYQMHVEFLSDEIKANEEVHTQPQLLVSKFKGTSFAFKHNFNHTIRAQIKEHIVKTDLKILDPIGSLILKALTLQSRYKEKDAYDIYMIIKHNKDPLKLRNELAELKSEKIVNEAIEILRKKFESRNSDGPFYVAEFLTVLNNEEKERIKTDVFMRINQILEGV